MIAKDQMMPALLAACPTFEPAWRQFLKEWENEPTEPPLYVALADFARCLTSMLEEGRTDEFPAVFAVIERLHLDGDPYVKEAATIGILESLLEPGPERFEAYFLPETKRWWNRLHRFWDGDPAALREPRADMSGE